MIVRMNDGGARHMDEMRIGALQYARRQQEIHAGRNKTGKCHLDNETACGLAWRCGIEHKVEACAAFTMKPAMANRCGGVATKCTQCAKVDKTPCGWECARRLVLEKGART